MDLSFIEYAGHRLAVYTTGKCSGLSCIFIHGGPGGRSPQEFGDLLSENFRTIMYDQYGGGESDPYDGLSDLSPDYFMNEAKDVIPRLTEEDYVLIGYSWGAAPAVEYASTTIDQHLRGLILISPFISGPQWTRDQLSILRDISPGMAEDMGRFVREGYVGQEAMNILATLFERVLFMEEENRATAHRFAHVPNGKVCLRLWGKNDGIPIGPLKDLDLTGKLSSITVPTVIIYGQNDQVCRSTAENYRSLLKNGSCIEIENAGHYSIREHPDVYLKEISDFINDKVKPQQSN